MGNYGIVLSLLGCLEHGIKSKKLVDKVIDVCAYPFLVLHCLLSAHMQSGDHVVNLREEIFLNRVRYSLTTAVDDKERDGFLSRAVKALEK